MRKTSLAAALFSLVIVLPCFASASGLVEFERVWPRYRDTASFTRLGEYFGAAPDATNRHALRSQPASRAGYYWMIRTRSDAPLTDCTVALEILRSGTVDVQTHTFTTDLASGRHPFHLGLTGSDWTDPAERPIAWRITLTASDGTPLNSTQSFLWDQSTS